MILVLSIGRPTSLYDVYVWLFLHLYSSVNENETETKKTVLNRTEKEKLFQNWNETWNYAAETEAEMLIKV